MKQVTYEFDWLTIIGALVASTIGIEDGFWQLNINTESITENYGAPVANANQLALPGHLVRITGIRLTKVPFMNFMCVEVKNGLITEVTSGVNTNNNRPVEGSESVGENSGDVGEADSLDGFRTSTARAPRRRSRVIRGKSGH